MRRRHLIAILLTVAALACGTEPLASANLLAGEGQLAIQTHKSVYSASEASFSGEGIVATVTNMGTTPAYARLGDAFNSAQEQERLFAVTGSDGHVERRTGASAWNALASGILVEGVSVVVMHPGKSYELRAALDAGAGTGATRLRITFFDSPQDVGRATPHEAVSNTFEIR